MSNLSRASLKKLRIMAAASDDGWRAAALEIVRRIATSQPVLASDEVWSELQGVKPSEPRFMGGVFETAQARGYIKATDRIWPSRRRASHGRPVRVWDSNLFKKD